MLAACLGASLTAPSAQLMSVHRQLIWHVLNVLIKWWACMCLKELSPNRWCVETYLWRSTCFTSQMYFRVTSVLMFCWGKIILFSYSAIGGSVYYCSLCLAVDWISPERKLDFSFPFTLSLSCAYINWWMSVQCCVCDNLYFHELLHLLFPNKLYLHVMLLSFWWQQRQSRWSVPCLNSGQEWVLA